MVNQRRLALPNPHLTEVTEDFLYHLGLTTHDNLSEMFRDVKFIVMGGSSNTMLEFAKYARGELYLPSDRLENLCRSERYGLWKVGPLLVVAHGVGAPSITILLHELFKLVHYSNATNVMFIRVGTSAGIGVEPGTIVISENALNASLRKEHRQVVLGQEISRPTILDQVLAQALLMCQNDPNIPSMLGSTLCAEDFYEGQGRLDGAFCDYTEEDKIEYLRRAYSMGCRNIEMESCAFSSLCHRAGVRGAVVCVTLIDRLQSDLMSPPDVERYDELVRRPHQLVIKFIKRQLGLKIKENKSLTQATSTPPAQPVTS
ncbi:uridine phosphorylase 1-like [Bolinopsis microptera]|uniref:uridine phosphorylase 1-like n=1 Tax=Bolinopsis microptera TaxID=2820187 RepID=UPI003078B725